MLWYFPYLLRCNLAFSCSNFDLEIAFLFSGCMLNRPVEASTGAPLSVACLLAVWARLRYLYVCSWPRLVRESGFWRHLDVQTSKDEVEPDDGLEKKSLTTRDDTMYLSTNETAERGVNAILASSP